MGWWAHRRRLSHPRRIAAGALSRGPAGPPGDGDLRDRLSRVDRCFILKESRLSRCRERARWDVGVAKCWVYYDSNIECCALFSRPACGARRAILTIQETRPASG